LTCNTAYVTYSVSPFEDYYTTCQSHTFTITIYNTASVAQTFDILANANTFQVNDWGAFESSFYYDSPNRFVRKQHVVVPANSGVPLTFTGFFTQTPSAIGVAVYNQTEDCTINEQAFLEALPNLIVLNGLGSGGIDISSRFHPSGNLLTPLHSCGNDPNYPNTQAQLLVIAGAVYVDEDYCLLEPGSQDGDSFNRVVFRPGARLIVKSGAVLTMRNREVFSCEGMYESILVEAGGTLIMDNCSVKHGIHAVKFAPGSSGVIRNSTFENNYIGCYIEGGGAGTPSIPEFFGNTFRGTAALDMQLQQEHCPEMPMPSGHVYPLCGVYVNKAWPVRIGRVGENRNDFTGITNGIISRDAALRVENSQFTSMYYDAGIMPYSGRGVTAFQGFLSLTGFGKHSSTKTFSNARQAIHTDGVRFMRTHECGMDEVDWGLYSRNSYINFYDNKITNGIVGVESRQPIYTFRARIVDNDLSVSRKGVLTYFNDSPLTEIANNMIKVDGDIQGVGIEDYDSGAMLFSAHPYGKQIRCNQIELRNSRRGISLNMPAKSWVGYNTVDLMESGVNGYRGIDVEGGQQAHILENRVYGPDSEGLPAISTGILARNHPGGLWSCNLTHWTEIGMQFLGNCMSEDQIQGNYLGMHAHGLLAGVLPEGGEVMLGTQHHTGNRWPLLNEEDAPSTGQKGATHTGDQNQIDFSTFKVNKSQNKEFYPLEYIPNGSSWFFNDISDTSSVSCSGVNCASAPSVRVPWVPGGVDVTVSGGDVPLGDHSGGHLWDAQRYLYLQITNHPEVISSYPALDTFYQMAMTEDLGEMYEARMLGWSALVPDSARLAEWLAREAEYQKVADSLLLLWSAYDGGLSPTDSVYVLEGIGAWGDTLQLVTTSLQSWVDLGDSLRSQSEQEALDAYDGLSPLLVYAQETKAVEELWLTAIAGGADTLTPGQEAMLEAISDYCIIDGGQTVAMARQILRYYGSEVVWHDSLLCQTASLRSVKDEAAGIKELKVWPNPTTGQLQVLLPGDLDAYRLELLDIYGRRIWMDRISQEGLRTVDFSSYPTGQYWLQARTADGKVFSQLIMITR
jgi:hypothetical protein